MLYTKLTKMAMKLCFEKHKDQIDKSGIPYPFHPFHVAESMKDEYTTCVALLHDIIEDTDTKENDLLEIGFPKEVVDAIKMMTHDSNIDYFDYVRNLKTNPICRAVKLADLKHNSDLSRFDEITEFDLKRQNKYLEAIKILNE